MRFMMMVQTAETAGPPAPALMTAVGKLMGEMAGAGVLVDAGGLLPMAKGARLTLADSKVTVTDGPFIETKELIGGYAILEAASKEEAIELGKRFLSVHVEAAGPSYQATVEIRQMSEPPRAPAPARP
jgi:hypothetical protein